MRIYRTTSILTVFLVFLCLPSFGLTGDSLRSKRMMYVKVAPEAAFSWQSPPPKKNSGFKHVPVFGFQISGGLLYSFHPHWQLECGLSVARKGYRSVFEGNFRVNDQNDPIYQQLVGSGYSVENTLSYYFATLPVRFSGTFGKGRMKFLSSLGLEPGYAFYGNKLYEEYINGTTTRTRKDFKPDPRINLFAEAGAGIEYRVTPTSYLRALPFFSVGLVNLGQSSTSYRLCQAGMSLGWFWGKKK